ncbi:hypothetical protein [Luteolibacter sp. AS25]|uniref:hypothetical protein n=1 Tax=Luteolibacter sp. AS25 TaxID=3135776 RepID=UPI00398B7904
MRLFVPLLFIGLCLGVILGVKTFLQRDLGAPDQAAASGSAPDRVREILPEDDVTTFEDLTEDGTPAIPIGDPTMPDLGSPVTGFPDVDPGIATLKLLEDFLAMETLEERLPHIETKQDESALLSSVLNGPLPEVAKITVDIRETNQLEQLVDYYYYVDFVSPDGGVNPQAMLVRTRGTSPPKVVVDPFLDLFGGRFARYAAEPTKEAGKFQVIVTAGAFCYDDVPNPEKKFTLKILPRDDAKEIAKAYFGKASKIGEMLEDETSGLSFGQAKACTVFLRWNMDDDPQKPFLEALDIISLDWNP